MNTHRRRGQLGYTLIELLVVLSMTSVLLTTATVNLTEMVNPSEQGAATVAAFMKEVRAHALSTTLAFEVYPITTKTLGARFASSCSSASFTNDDSLSLELPQRVDLTDLTWSVCFSPRGFADASILIPLEDHYEGTKDVQVFLGGAIRTQ
ncbi:MAG: type II secretion system protein [Bdellovibrionales bacterium]|nr:type II secretion system protein [Bdellovibrionales bacterium]